MPKKEDMLSLSEEELLGFFEKEIKKAEKTLEKIDLIYKKDLRRLDHLSDRIAEIGGSWSFIITFLVVLFSWMILNSWILATKSFDPFPYILLNLILSTIAAIQAPIILMAQNRAAKRDQVRAQLDLDKDLRDLKLDEQQIRLLLKMQKDIEKLKKR